MLNSAGDAGTLAAPARRSVLFLAGCPTRVGVADHRHRRIGDSNDGRGVAPEKVGKREALLPIANQWLELHRRFQGHAHAGLEQGAVNEEELQTRFATLESQINALIGEFYEPVATLDEILQDTNS